MLEILEFRLGDHPPAEYGQGVNVRYYVCSQYDMLISLQ